jgi:hypothetical protein
MKPQVFFPILLAAAGLTVLMLLVMSSAGQVAGQLAGTDTPAGADSDAAYAAITVPITLPWQAVAPGIDYVALTLTNPANYVYIARFDRSVLSNTLETSIASGYLYSGKETVSQQAARYDQAINYWGQAPLTPTWGSRNEVVVAINGSYYDVPNGLPWSGMVQSGWYAKRFDDLGGSSGFAWKLDRTAFIGECVDHVDNKQLVTFADGTSQPFQGINITRTNHALIVYTPQFDTHTHTDDKGTEVLVELSRPLLLISSPRAVTGTITAVYTGTGSGSTPIPFDSVVLSAGKAITDSLWSHLQVGDVISISQEIKSYHFDCGSSFNLLDWGKTYASLSGGFYFLKNGNPRHYDDPGATERLPRTAIAFNSDYIYFIVVNGRSWMSRGMSMDELAVFARDTLSATYGISQDGGGSSTMVVNGEVKNDTLCNNVFCTDLTFLPLLGRVSETVTATAVTVAPIPTLPPIHSDEIDAVTAERYVANGIMMVVVQPMTASLTFTPTQMVMTVAETDLYLGPGTNYGPLADIPDNASGVIVPHTLNGVLAKGSYWWKVDFGGVQGWVKEINLTPVLDDWR